MNWENINFSKDEPETKQIQASFNTRMEVEQDEIEKIQLRKFQDPSKNIERQGILTLLKRFGDLLKANNINDIVNNILTDDCQFFLFSSTGRIPVQYCLQPTDLHKLYQGRQIQERIVRETYIDLEKSTAMQICNFRILYQGEANPVEEVVAEIFTIKNNKISKYRAFAGKMTAAHGDSDPFEITSRDRALAVVTQVNYALAGQPDFEKVTHLFNENIKYKIWSWDSQKCFILEKQNFVESLQNMQENFEITSIVPYEVYTEGNVAVGTYAYHLEGKAMHNENKKYVWLTTCFYVLDDNYKIIKVSQQGDLRQEGEIKVQFEVYPRDKITQKLLTVFSSGPTIEQFYSDVFALNCIAYAFGPETAPNIGFNKGTIIVDRMKEWANRASQGNAKSQSESQSENKPEKRLVESLFDCCDSSYDVVIFIHRINQIFVKDSDMNDGGTTIIVSRFKLEHGKIVKACGFITPISESFPSPFDD